MSTQLLNAMQQYNIVKINTNCPFTLKSGQKSNFYIDARQIISYPSLFKMVCKELYTLISPLLDKNTVLCGVPTGAIPFASYIAGTYNIPMIMPRNTPKSYGMKHAIEGKYSTSTRIIILEDVVMTGGSILEIVSLFGPSQVIGIISIFNRGEHRYSIQTIPFNYLFESSQIMNWNSIRTLSPTIVKSYTTNRLCIAIDFTTTTKIRKVIEILGPHVGLIKLHCDIIDDFNDDFITYLNNAKKRLGLLIWEDRKFGDIGRISQLQLHHGVYKISSWADIISCHAVGGELSIPDDIEMHKTIDSNSPSFKSPAIILIAELSCKDQLLDSTYANKVIEIANKHEKVIGIVCQHAYSGLDNLLTIVPGISVERKEDNQGQQYVPVFERNFADIFVVGRAITGYEDMLKRLKEISQEITH